VKTTTVSSIRLGKSTTVRVIVDRQERDPMQMELFLPAKEMWVREMMHVAMQMPSRFWFSELRMMAAHEPDNVNYWGSVLVPRMKKAGFKQTGNFRRHTRESRNGGVEFEWSRVQ
jgi:hypothetical protein